MRPILALGCALALLIPFSSRGDDRPTLLVPARSDSAPPESEPAPLLGPGRPNPRDSTMQSAEQMALQQYRLGVTMEASNRVGPGIAAFRNAVRLDPTMRDANYRLGKLLLQAGRLSDALACFAAEVARDPKNLDAARELGLTLARLGDRGRSIAQLERLTRKAPRDGRNWHALGFAYRAADRPLDAEAALRKAVQLPPDDAEEHRDLGALLAERKRDREARDEYRRALALSPRDPTTWLNLANLERRAGRRDSALVCYARAEGGDSTFSLAYRGQIALLREQERLVDAGEVYRRWLRNRPEEHGARLEAVRLFDTLHQPEIALEIARDGVRDAGDTGQPHLIYGMVLADQGRSREALRELRRAERMFHEHPADVRRAAQVIERLRASAPDSLREFFRNDSLSHARRAP